MRDALSTVELGDLVDGIGTVAKIGGYLPNLRLLHWDDRREASQHLRFVARHLKHIVVRLRLVIELTCDGIEFG